MKRSWNDTDSRRKSSLSASLSVTNPIWFELGSNLNLRREGSATNRLNLLGPDAGSCERD